MQRDAANCHPEEYFLSIKLRFEYQDAAIVTLLKIRAPEGRLRAIID